MTEWTTCSQCNLKHRQRADAVCPRCKEPLAAEVAAAAPAPEFSGPALSALSFARAGAPLTAGAAGTLPDVYDDRPLPRSKLEREGAEEDPTDSPWFSLAGGLAVLWLAYSLHGDFGDLASGARESVRVWWVIAWLYRRVGPEITVALVGLVGALLTWSGLRRLS
jgi:hypothetical protein